MHLFASFVSLEKNLMKFYQNFVILADMTVFFLTRHIPIYRVKNSDIS